MKIDTMCGAKWYRWRDWVMYVRGDGLFRRWPDHHAFRIGPLYFWDGK